MNTGTQVILRKIGGRFDACWRGMGMPNTLAVSGGNGFSVPSVRALLALFLMPLVLLGALALLLTFGHVPTLTSGHGALGVAGFAVIGQTADELMAKLTSAFAEFRASNDERLKQIEARGYASAEVVANVEKANAAVTALSAEVKELQAQHKELETANARIVQQGASKSETREQEVLNTARFFSLVRGKPVPNVTDEDIGAYRAYRSAFSAYLRKGEAAYADRDIRDALSTGAAPAGGFWLTPDSSGRIVEYLEDLSSMRSMATVSSIGTDTFEGFYDLDEGSSGWVGETDARPETGTPRIDGKYSFPIFEQYANPKASQKMLDDSETDVEGWLAKKVAQKMAKTENSAFVIGDGVSKPKGFATYAAGTPARTSVANYRKIRQINSGAAAGFAATSPGDKFIDLIQAIPASIRGGSSFAMTTLSVAEVRKLKDGDGNYLFIPDFSKGPNGTVLGYGINELSDMAEIAADALAVAFGNWKEAYEIKDHTIGTRVLRDPYTGKPYVSFYTTKRVGGDVVNFQALVLMKMHT